MTTPVAALVAVLVLGAAGALPVFATAGPRWVSAPLAPLAGSVLAALAAIACLVFGGAIVVWFIVLAVAAGATALLLVSRRRGRAGISQNAASDPPGGASPMYRRAGIAGAAVIAVTVTGSLLALRAPSIGFDARTIWLLHAVWFTEGHRAARAALSNPALPFAHSSYPPLIGGSVAVSWLLTANHSYTLGVVVIALLNACAVSTAAWTAVEVGRHCGAHVAVVHAHPGGPPPGRGHLEAPYVAGVVVAGLLVLVAYGVAGPFATNGYADLLWSAAAVGAVGFALMLPTSRRDFGVAAILVLVAGLTKQEGTATAVVIVALMTIRLARAERAEHPGVPGRSIAAGLFGLLVLGVWPLLMVAFGASQNVAVPGRRVGDDASRAHLTLVAMASHLHVVLLAAVVAALGGAALRKVRRRVGLGNDVWAWVVLIVAALLVAFTYMSGAGNVAFWLATSVHRTTFFPAICAWWIIGTWAVVGTSQGAVPAGGERMVEGLSGYDPLDEPALAVLHHQS